MNLCLTCNKVTNNPKFCSRSCSAKFTNKIPKRKRSASSICFCGKTKAARNKTCRDCRETKKASRTIADTLYIKHNHQASKYSIIRNEARQATKHLPRICSTCGYTKHVEVAHIKSIPSFKLTDLVSKVNCFSNLALLCPNHHWEFDNKLLTNVRSVEAPTGFEPA